MMCVFGTPDSNPDSVIQIYNHWVPQKKLVWFLIFEWELKSQLEFYVDPMLNLNSAFHLFLNLNRIQIRTKFMWVPVYYRYWAHVFSFLPIFSLSFICFSASLSIHWRKTHSSSKKTSAGRRHLAKPIAKKNSKSKPFKLNQQEHDKTKKKERSTEKKTETHML